MSKQAKSLLDLVSKNASRRMSRVTSKAQSRAGSVRRIKNVETLTFFKNVVNKENEKPIKYLEKSKTLND